jgi:hypothetical protein
MSKNPQLIQEYFRAKRHQLLAMSELAVVEHSGLRGSHREELQRIFLREILPRRFSVGHGMVYGLLHRSKEADIVIWDADNYPSLPLANQGLFFAESVRIVLESKSTWGTEQFTDVLAKCRSVRDIVTVGSGSTLEDQIAMLRLDLHALKHGIEHDGMLISKPHIGTVAIFIRGGQAAMTDLSEIPDNVFDEADDSWPDLIVWLEPGRVAFKQYPESGGLGYVEVFDYGEDSLFVFTNGLLRLLADRSVVVEDYFYLDQYMMMVEGTELSSRSFPLRRLPPERRPLWRT